MNLFLIVTVLFSSSCIKKTELNRHTPTIRYGGCRLEWHNRIDPARYVGHGDWYPFSEKIELEDAAKRANRDFPENTHEVVCEDIV